MIRPLVAALFSLFLSCAAAAQGLPNVGGYGIPNSTGGGTTLTPGQLPGTTTNDNASAGNVGQYITSSVASPGTSVGTTGSTVNITSILLTAGDWDVHGNVCFNLSGTTATNLAGAINITTAVFTYAGW